MMRIQHVLLGQQPVMPWANGGGSTRQIAIDPPEGSLGAGFRWRVSIAQVGCDSPFSRLPGIDRSLWLLRGAGVRLDVEGSEVVLARQFQRFDFAGETPITARLLEGPVEDLNVMVKRRSVRAESNVVELEAGAAIDVAPAAQSLVVVLAGSLRTRAGQVVGVGDALRVDGDGALHAVCAGASTLLTCRFHAAP
ncbi:MAG: HutD family protein [Planctomycetota bacterium]